MLFVGLGPHRTAHHLTGLSCGLGGSVVAGYPCDADRNALRSNEKIATFSLVGVCAQKQLVDEGAYVVPHYSVRDYSIVQKR